MSLVRVVPALLITISKGPCAWNKASTAVLSRTSSVSYDIFELFWPPALVISAQAAIKSGAFRATINTCAPACTSACAAAKPMPLEPPVTKARLPSRRKLGVCILLSQAILKPVQERAGTKALQRACHSGAREYWPARHGLQSFPYGTTASSIRRSERWPRWW
jgi:hypothetical protein